MATRHQAREAVVQLLYSYDLGNVDAIKYADDILAEKKIKNKQREFALELYRGTIANLEAIDQLIAPHLKEGGVGSLEKSILRLGVYEMVFGGLDVPIVINEAVEIAKKLGADNSPKLINGVLDAIQKRR